MKMNLRAKCPDKRLWYFVAFAFGCATYFGLNFEPDWRMCLVLAPVLGFWAYLYKSFWRFVLFFFVLGVSVVTCRTRMIETHILMRPLWRQQMTGRVEMVVPREKGQSITISDIKMGNNATKIHRAYFNIADKQVIFHVGDQLTFTGDLYPPMPTQRRRFFFQGIGARGRILSIEKQIIKETDKIQNLRQTIMARLKALLPDEQAQIAIPLVVGEQQIVSQKMYDIYRKAGIAHVLSVSGFHMTLLAGFVFFLIRGVLSLIPWLALRVNTKKIAAILAFVLTGFYFQISGCQVPATRSFLMIILVFSAVLLDRRVWSLYGLLLVGFLILLLRPEWVVSVSFQLSFIAVMVLVGILENVYKWYPNAKIRHWLFAAICANVVVTLALAPFIVFHFNQFNPYGVIGNLLTNIFFSFLIMPLLFVGTILMPLGWESPFIKSAGFVLEKMSMLAEKVANLPGSEILSPSICATGLGIFTFGLVWCCLIKKTKVRIWGVLVCVLGIIWGYVGAEIPSIIVAEQGRVIAIREKNRMVVKGDMAYWRLSRWAKMMAKHDIAQKESAEFYVRERKITTDPALCSDASLAIIPRRGKCTARYVLAPRKNHTYFVYLNDSVKIVSEESIDQNRPWGLKQQRRKK